VTLANQARNYSIIFVTQLLLDAKVKIKQQQENVIYAILVTNWSIICVIRLLKTVIPTIMKQLESVILAIQNIFRQMKIAVF